LRPGTNGLGASPGLSREKPLTESAYWFVAVSDFCRSGPQWSPQSGHTWSPKIRPTKDGSIWGCAGRLPPRGGRSPCKAVSARTTRTRKNKKVPTGLEKERG